MYQFIAVEVYKCRKTRSLIVEVWEGGAFFAEVSLYDEDVRKEMKFIDARNERAGLEPVDWSRTCEVLELAGDLAKRKLMKEIDNVQVSCV